MSYPNPLRYAGVVLPLAVACACACAGASAAARTPLFQDDFSNVAGWQRQGVVMTGTLGWEGTLLQDPSIVYGAAGGSKFKMWYGALYYVGYATSDDGLTWSKRADPALSRTLDTEMQNLNQPSVVYKDGMWHMIYHARGGNVSRIHYATATNPEGPWTKHGPVLSPTMDWEDNYLYNSSLMYDTKAGVWKMWYTAGEIASAGGEPKYICYATAPDPGGPWTKYAGNPIVAPMNDGGWASLGIGGPNVRKLADGSYEMVVVGWQASYPSRGGKMHSKDGIHWTLARDAMHLDLGLAGTPDDGMVYRQFIVDDQGSQRIYYNAKSNTLGNEAINAAVWNPSLSIVDPAKWAQTQGASIPNGASFEVRDGRAHALGNAASGQMQTLQGNVRIGVRDYSVQADVTPTSPAPAQRDSVLILRATDRGNYYYAGIASWGHQYAIGRVVDGVNAPLATVGSATDIVAGATHHLCFVARGAELSLYDGGALVASASDASLLPAQSYVGLENAASDGQAWWDNVAAYKATAKQGC